MARRRTAPEGRYSVSAPEIRWSSPSLGAAISYAQGVAERAKGELTLYVRDISGEVLARIETGEHGAVYTYGYHSIRV